MNLSTSSVGATAVNAARTATYPAGQDAAATDSREAFGLLVGLLAQTTAPATSPTATATSTPGGDEDATATDEPAIDCSLPFVAPAVPATPPDLAPPDPDADPGVTPIRDAHALAGATSLAATSDSITARAPGARDARGEPVAETDRLTNPAGPATARVEAASQEPSHVVVARTAQVPMGDARWPGHVGHEVRLLVGRGVQTATLRISPEHLGPVEVRIDVVGEKAHVLFGAAHPETRAALGEAIPRLRDMLADGGLALGEAGVRQDTADGFGPPAERPARAAFAPDAPEEAAGAAVAVTVRVGLVDAYA